MKPFEQQTYYELLEIPVTAPEAEIREAYERALETYSPDSVAVYALVDPGQVDALRARLTEAMEILTEPDLRAEYDRMIGVKRGEQGAVVALAPALAAAAQSVSPQAPAATPAANEVPVAAAAAREVAPASVPEAVTPATPAPAAVSAAPEPTPAVASAAPEPTPAAPEPAPASTVAPAEPSSMPTPVAPAVPGPLVMPGMVTPNQIHAAFRSYAISYVPVLVPAPSQPGSAFLSPFTPPAQAGVPQPGPQAPSEAKTAEPAAPSALSAAPTAEAVAAQAPKPAAEPVQPPVPVSSSTAEAAPRSVSAAAPVPATSAEQASAPATPATAIPAEAPRATTAPAPSELARPPEPASEPASEKPAPAVVHHEEDELSGVRAPLPSPGDARAASSGPGRPTPSSRPERPVRPTYTPPPLPPGRRAIRSTPTVQQGSPAGEAGKGTSRPAQGSGMDLEEAQQIAQESAIATAEAALAQVAAKAREPRPKPIELPPNAEFNGEVLRQVRESRGQTLQQVAERTRISSKHLENVEADRYAALPATVYLRGILMNLARELGLDPLKVSRSYLALATAPKKK